MTLLVASAAVTFAALAMAAAMPRRGTLAFLVATGLLVDAIVVSTVGFAGLVLRSLDGVVLLGLALVWAVAGGLVLSRRPDARRWRERSRGAATRLIPALRWLPALVALVLVVGTLAWRTFLALRLPIIDYDGWSYHLVFADVWLQHDAIVPVLQRPWTAGYPADAELLTTWLMAFSRSDALAGFTSLLPIPLAIVATMGLARSFGAARPTAALAGLVFGMTPAMVGLTGTTYVDAASVAAIVSTWWLGVRVVRGERHPSTVLLLAIAAGLAVGTKGTNALLVGPLGAAAAVVLVLDLVRAPRGARALHAWNLAILVLPVLVLGGSWYLKNLVEFGNPLYPFALGPLRGVTTLADFQIAPPQLEGRSPLGKLAASWTWDWSWHRYAYNVRPGGLGRAWPVILVAGALGAVVMLRRRRWVPLALVVLPAAVTVLVMPENWYARLTLFLPALGLALTAVALDVLRPTPRLLAGLGLVAIAAISLVFVNVRPNIDLRPQLVSQTNTRAYLRFLLADETTRHAIGLRATCAAFDQIPAGAIVAPGNFNLLHAAVGSDLSRELSSLLPRVKTPDELVAAMDDRHATWLVTSAGNNIDELAARASGALVNRGDSCEGSRIWERVSPP